MTNLSEIQISADALRHNLDSLKILVPPGAKVAAVVKGNAYGHGLREIVGLLDGHVDYFQVDDIDELRALRAITKTPALVLGYIPRSQVKEAIELEAELALYDLDRLPEMAGARVHLKIDALLGRQGILPNQVDSVLAALQKHSSIELTGVYGHYANIEDTTDLTHALAQKETFDGAFERVNGVFPNAARHLSATSGLLTMEPDGNCLIRLGIGLYGLYPSGPLARTHASLNLCPVMRWVSHVAQVKTLPAHHPVGYGLTYITPRETKIGIVPQGYADGYDRGLSNCGEVLVAGQRCPVLGRVAMNMFAIDLTPAPAARAEDEVVLLGDQGDHRITAEEIAARIQTINYEIPTRVSSSLPRTVK